MHLLKLTLAVTLLSLTACSGRVQVATHDPVQDSPHPTPPHQVRGPVASLGIPPGHYPPPGQCRVWIPGRPPGRQARPVPCRTIGAVPLGAWVLHRPAGDKKVIEVSAYDAVTPEVVVSVAWYDARTGFRVDARAGR